MMRCILHVDMDAFFAAVELQRHPELRGKPLIIGGKGNPMQRGVVSTASYEARKFRVHSGMPLRTALAHCPNAVFLPVDYPTYTTISKKIKTILNSFSDVMEDAGIDEAFLDLSAECKSAETIANCIKQRIREKTGLTCSIGLAPNKLLAKIASDMEKPDGFTVVKESDIEIRIWPLGVRTLWGVGPKAEEKLASLGVTCIGHLAQLPKKTLITHFGQAHGLYLHRASRGIDDSPIVTQREPKSLSRETTFQTDVDDWDSIERTVIHLTKEVITRMRKREYRGRNITVKLRFADFDTHTHAITLATQTDNFEMIQSAVMKCLHRFALVKPVRLIGVRVSDLTPTGSGSNRR